MAATLGFETLPRDEQNRKLILAQHARIIALEEKLASVVALSFPSPTKTTKGKR
jgi:hypothetical protein